MDRSFQLFRLRGIPVRLHYTFPILLVLVAVQFAVLSGFQVVGALAGFLITMLLFVIVLVHELGHSFAAQYYEIEVEEVVLLPIGGMATLSDYPSEPKEELVIASAGPAINLILAGSLMAVSLGISKIIPLELNLTLRYNVSSLAAGNILGYLIVANLVLAAFNLIPAFPLDGGRILRALLAIKFDYESATRLAAILGQMVAAHKERILCHW
ncbi:MAG: site-2 protease family protein [Anaerolineales bacterium]|nr:site-2 protease family protein [Anaerolineales bacterium]